MSKTQIGPATPVEVFFCYSQKDKRYRDELETQFAPMESASGSSPPGTTA